MVERYTVEAIHRLCGNTHTLGATSNVPSTARRTFKLGHHSKALHVRIMQVSCIIIGLLLPRLNCLGG
jgi:hypothetical protein